MHKKGSANTILIALVIVLAMALGYVTLVKKPTVPNDEQPQNSSIEQTTQTNQPNTDPVLSDNEATALVKADWGDCTPDTCSRVVVSVSKQGSSTYVTATYEGLRDDSSRASRKVAIASYANGQWTLGEPTATQQCQPGRGHQDFSAELCF